MIYRAGVRALFSGRQDYWPGAAVPTPVSYARIAHENQELVVLMHSLPPGLGMGNLENEATYLGAVIKKIHVEA